MSPDMHQDRFPDVQMPTPRLQKLAQEIRELLPQERDGMSNAMCRLFAILEGNAQRYPIEVTDFGWDVRTELESWHPVNDALLDFVLNFLKRMHRCLSALELDQEG